MLSGNFNEPDEHDDVETDNPDIGPIDEQQPSTSTDKKVEAPNKSCNVCHRTSVRTHAWYFWTLCENCKKKAYDWEMDPPESDCTQGNSSVHNNFSCSHCRYKQMKEIGVLSTVSANLLFGSARSSNATSQLSVLGQLEYLQKHFNMKRVNWFKMPGDIAKLRKEYEGLTGLKFSSLWFMLDKLGQRVRNDPTAFVTSGNEANEFGWSMVHWYNACIRIAFYLDSTNGKVGTECIAACGPHLNLKERANLNVSTTKTVMVGRIMAFLEHGPPPTGVQASHLCHFRRCGYWKHLIWELPGRNNWRVDCVNLAKNNEWSEEKCDHEPKCLLDGYFEN